MAFVSFFSIDDVSLKSQICEDILRFLPQWWRYKHGDYSQGVKACFFIVAKVNEDVVGFISIKENTAFTDEIYIMGIKKEYHRTGIGGELVKRAAKHSKDLNKKLMSVSLSPSGSKMT